MHRWSLTSVVAAAVASACGGGSSPGAATPVSTPAPTPTPGSAFGPAGGALTAPGGSARLEIPAGALSGQVFLALRAVTSVPLDPQAVAGTAFEIAPAVSFASPARLFLRYGAAAGPSGVDPGEFRVHTLGAGRWEPAGAAHGIDRAGSEVFAEVSASGVYGLRWPGPTSDCTGGEHRQFDFWLGSWTFRQVLPPTNGTATNDISRDATGCLIFEDFRSAGRGASVSLVSPLDGQWHQTYIDDAGTRLLLIGRFDEGRMVLQQSPTQRYVWDPLERGRIRYSGERTIDGANWLVFFDSFYTAPGP